MKFGLCREPVAPLFEKPRTNREEQAAEVSGLADELLYGWVVRIDEELSEWVKVTTHYNYEGYVRKEFLIPVTERQFGERQQHTSLRYINQNAIDVLKIPKVQGKWYKTLYRGSYVNVIDNEETEDGWIKVALLDGRIGYTRSLFLTERKDSDLFLLSNANADKPLEEQFECIPNLNTKSILSLNTNNEISLLSQLTLHTQNETEFRQAIVDSAMKFMGTQYRWGGKTILGIDCSGLAFMSYLENGVLIYRDASIKEGFPIKKIDAADKKMGDLLFFPGHVAIYMGNNKFVHATAFKNSCGVVINSLSPEDSDYRQDLKDSMYAVGSIF